MTHSNYLAGTVFTFFLAILTMTSCEKQRIRNNCCEDTYEIITTKYLEPDSFALYIPQAFTPNGDNRNEYFTPIGRGFEIERMIVKKRLKTVYEYDEHIAPYWDGGDEKDGSYNYEMTLRLSTGDPIDVEGSVCIIRYGGPEEKNYDLKRETICSCTLRDMIDPAQGVIYDSQECPEGSNFSDGGSDDSEE